MPPAVAFRAPPGWPDPPPGWMPPQGWQPPEDWPPPPEGWEFYLELPSRRDEFALCRTSLSLETRRAYATISKPARKSPSTSTYRASVGFLIAVMFVAVFATLALHGAFSGPQQTPPTVPAPQAPVSQECPDPPATTPAPGPGVKILRDLPTGQCRT